MDWVMRLPVGARGVGVAVDALVVAGDVAETWDNFARTMAALRERFGAIFYVPGNHDLWLHRENGRYMDSLEKLTALLDACSELGVEIAPYELRTISGPVTDPSKLPKWDYDSSSTSQAPARTVRSSCTQRLSSSSPTSSASSPAAPTPLCSPYLIPSLSIPSAAALRSSTASPPSSHPTHKYP